MDQTLSSLVVRVGKIETQIQDVLQELRFNSAKVYFCTVVNLILTDLTDFIGRSHTENK